MTILATAIAWGLSTATLHPCPDADACVTVANRLSSTPDVVDGILWMDGLPIAVHVEMGPGDAPDTVTITAPVGFRVEPASAEINEGADVLIRLYFPEVG